MVFPLKFQESNETKMKMKVKNLNVKKHTDKNMWW